jgi:hypothetical protein
MAWGMTQNAYDMGVLGYGMGHDPKRPKLGLSAPDCRGEKLGDLGVAQNSRGSSTLAHPLR